MNILTGYSAREQIDRLRFFRAKRSICALGDLTIPDYKASWHHKIKAQALEEAIRYARYAGERGGIARLLISEPPQHGKSLHAAALTPALALGQDPDMPVMSTAYDAKLAGRAVENTRAIMTHPDYLRTFPTRIGKARNKEGKVVSAKDQASFFKTMRAHSDGSVTPAAGQFYSGGVTSGLTGHGFRLGIMDDWIKDEQAATSYAAQLHRIGQYTKAFGTRKQGPSAIVAIGAMWDNPDWLDWLWEMWELQGHSPVWIRFPSLTDDYAGELHPDDPREPGSDESLWEDRFPTAEQRKERDGLIIKDKSAWCALYQQNPIKIAGQLFPKRAWQWYQTTGEHAIDLKQFDSIHFSVDGNLKETGSSWAVIGVYALLKRRIDGANVVHYFRIDESRGHYEFSQFRDETLGLWNKWLRLYPRLVRAGRVWVEDKANGSALMSQLAGRGIPFSAVPKTRNKVSCYRMAQLAVMENRVWLPADSDGSITDHWVGGPTGFVSELAAQPAQPDDRADEFSQMVICNDPNLGIDLLRL